MSNEDRSSTARDQAAYYGLGAAAQNQGQAQLARQSQEYSGEALMNQYARYQEMVAQRAAQMIRNADTVSGEAYSAMKQRAEQAERAVNDIAAGARKVREELEIAHRDAGRLADVQQMLDTSLEDNIELRQEVEWLQRELRRLDPRLWKARYGR